MANQIKQMLEEKFQVADKKTGGFRDITYKDIVILLRSTKTAAPIYEQELIQLGIQVFSDSSQEYLQTIEIETIISLLKIIDNPRQDIPLVTVLRSNIAGFTDNDLVEIRLSDKYACFYECLQKARLNADKNLRKKIENFLQALDQWRKEQEYLALDELIWKIYTDTGYYNYVGLMPNGDLRQANLKILFERAKQYETVNFKGLYHFIQFIEKLKLGSGDLSSAKLIGENDNVVRIMSIHKSKGLEFPVVFLASLGKSVNLLDLNESLLLHQEMGIGVKYINYEKQVQYDTLSKAAIRNKILTETLSEEMRILYVALTRAKEKLILTAVVKDYEKEKENMEKQIQRYPKIGQKINPILVKQYKRYIDWILLVTRYEKNKTKDSILLHTMTKAELMKNLTIEEKEDLDVRKVLENTKRNEEMYQKVKAILSYEYPNELATTIPTKMSVTQIKEMKQTKYHLKEISEEEGEKVGENRQEGQNTLTFPAPKFLKDSVEETALSAAQKGTLVHRCLQQLNEKVEYELATIKQLVQDLVNKQIFTLAEAKQINPYAILKFTKSEIWKEMKNAKEIYREKPFYTLIPAKQIYEKEIDEDILVQGIIDLYYIDKQGEITLVDYKTDYVEKGKQEELIQKYKEQLLIYQKVLEETLQRKVKNVYLYSVYLGETIQVKIN